MQFGLSAMASIAGQGQSNGFNAQTGNTNVGGGESGTSGFESLLSGLMGGGEISPDGISAEHMTREEVLAATQGVMDALAGLAEALKPLAVAFDSLQIPNTGEIEAAQDALAELVESVNVFPKNGGAGPHELNRASNKFLANLGQTELPQMRPPTSNATDFAKVGNLMEQINKILSQGNGIAPEQSLTENGTKPAMNLHDVIGQLQKLAENKGAPQYKGEVGLINFDDADGSTQNRNTQRGLPQHAGNVRNEVQQVEAARVASELQAAVANVNANAQNKAVQRAPTGEVAQQLSQQVPDVLSEIAKLGNNKQAPTPGQANIISDALAQNTSADPSNTNFAKATKEANLQAAVAYPELARSQTASSAAAMPINELDSVETGLEKTVAHNRVEQFQAQSNGNEATQSRFGSRQVNIPGMAFEIVRQVRAGAQRFEIKMDPPEMGRIDVQMEMDGKNVTARLVVERAETLDFLQRDARALERALQNAGLDSENTNLEFSLKQDGQDGSSNEFADQEESVPSWSNLIGSDDGQPSPAETNIYRGIANPGGLNVWA